MRLLSYSAALAGMIWTMNAGAHEAAVSRYRVNELPLPATLEASCLPGYAKGASIEKINDFGIVNAAFSCYSTVDLTAGIVAQNYSSFVAAPWFGAIALPAAEPGFSYSYGINNRGELFGYESSDVGGFFATKWTLAGGYERLFVDPTCEGLQFTAGVEGNGRYVVGWGFRKDPSFPIPFDTLCLTTRWLIRAPDGTEIQGPLNGTPAALNVLNVAVGTADRSAIRYQVPTGQTRVLHAADSEHSAEATDINDLGEAVGRITRNAAPDTFNSCDPGVAVRWERDGRERVLPHLPGAVSSHAFAVGYDGEVVGDSGAGEYCPYIDNAQERAVLWKGSRAYDLNTLIPRSAGVTLTYAFSVNRRGQVTAGGFVNAEPMTVCPTQEFDPVTATVMVGTVPCRNAHMFVLTPLGH